MKTKPDKIKREKLYLPRYLIYVVADNEEGDGLLDCLKHPKRIPSLGMDDELVNIKQVESIDMDKIGSNELHSVFIYDPSNRIESTDNVSDHFWAAKFTPMYRDFDAKTPRRGGDTVTIVEFCGLKFRLDRPIEVYHDKENEYNVQFI